MNIKDQQFSIEQVVLHGGTQEGRKVIKLTSKNGLTIALSPTCGMNRLYADRFGLHICCNSPVKEIVNSAFINLESRNGLGWLEGFNEWR